MSQSEVTSALADISCPDGDVGLQYSYSQVDFQEVQEVHVIAMATPPLMDKVSNDELMKHFNKSIEQLQKVKCFKCRSRPYFKLRLTFPSQGMAKMCIVRMNGSLLIGKHKLKLQMEQPNTRRHSLPTVTTDALQYKETRHSYPSPQVSLTQPLQMMTSVQESLACTNVLFHSSCVTSEHTSQEYMQHHIPKTEQQYKIDFMFMKEELKLK